MPKSRESLAVVRQLLSESVDSFEKLEILVHLHRRGDSAPATAIAKVLAMAGEAVAEALSELQHDGLVHVESAGWSLEATGPSASAVVALATLYDDDRLEVSKLMTELALDRVRAHAARRFANAFAIRMKRKGDPDT